jgi:hypothetical protein
MVQENNYKPMDGGAFISGASNWRDDANADSQAMSLGHTGNETSISHGSKWCRVLIPAAF